MKLLFPLLLISACILNGCSSLTSASEEPPRVIGMLIARFESAPMGNPPQSIWQYEYHGTIVYYVPPQCCDQFSELYDSSGNLLCAPDGGFTGTGDGRCRDFFTDRKNGKLIWRDPRDAKSA